MFIKIGGYIVRTEDIRRGESHPGQGEGTVTDAKCDDCGLPYADFGADIVLPPDQWLVVSGRPDSGALLCGTCIARRAAKIPGVRCILASLNIPERVTGAENE